MAARDKGRMNHNAIGCAPSLNSPAGLLAPLAHAEPVVSLRGSWQQVKLHTKTISHVTPPIVMSCASLGPLSGTGLHGHADGLCCRRQAARGIFNFECPVMTYFLGLGCELHLGPGFHLGYPSTHDCGASCRTLQCEIEVRTLPTLSDLGSERVSTSVSG